MMTRRWMQQGHVYVTAVPVTKDLIVAAWLDGERQICKHINYAFLSVSILLWTLVYP